MSETRLSIELSPQARLEPVGNNRWRLSAQGVEKIFSLRDGSPSSTVIAAISDGGLAMTRLRALAAASAATIAGSVEDDLERLWRAGVIVQTLRDDDGHVVAVLSGSAGTPLRMPVVDLSGPFTLTECAFVRRRGDWLNVESFDSGAVVELRASNVCAAPAMLVEPIGCADLAARLQCGERVAAALITWLVAIGAARRLTDAERPIAAGTGWPFADRLFHARTRAGRHVGGYGATFPGRGKFPCPPAVKPSGSRHGLPLFKPDLQSLLATDPPLTAVLENRRSVRDYDDDPITVKELGEFLYRSARVKGRLTNGELEFISRPYPSGGGLHELEFYLLVNACAGLDPGLYRYDGDHHALERASDVTEPVRGLLTNAAQSAPISGQIQVVVILAARFGRTNWKYESIAYALTLKHVGVVFQTLYLVATAMNLGACALGGGSSSLFSQAIDVSEMDESSVGEMLLGRPRGATPRARPAE
jgi:SagB-type dehydrogenase family enzyme